MENYSLQAHEAQVLSNLKDGKEKDVADIAKQTGLDQVAVVRASLSLGNLGMAKVSEEDKVVATITSAGKKVLKYGPPEKQLLEELGSRKMKLSEIKLKEKNIAIGWAKRKGLVDISKERDDVYIKANAKGKDALKKNFVEEETLERIEQGREAGREILENLKKRQLIKLDFRIIRKIKLTGKGLGLAKKVKAVKEVSHLTPALLKHGKWKSVKLRKYNVLAPVRSVYPGKRHFVNQAVEFMRKIYLEMGFREMEGPLVNVAFWNFDALFTAQDHPVRDLQDTFYIGRKGKLPSGKIVDRVKKAHEKGTPDSKGWQYSWDAEEARKLVLRTHTTVLSAKTLAQLKKEDWPAKYFAIGKCFRNETLDWSHLFEFNQFEGIVVDENANFRHLLGYLKNFFKKLGFPQARFRPAYFPYTEMSTEIDVFHPVHRQWIELGGAGIFRPEVVEPLLGEYVPVLAWGPGFDRILMDYYKITDIRDLYRNDVKQLREKKQWMW